MNKLVAVFLSIILLSIGSFALLWAISPNEEKDRVMATQGIRLVGSAVFFNAQNSTTPNKLKVGDLLIGKNEQVFRVNEIRKSQNNTIYVVVSWKYITEYVSYSEYVSEPYANYATYELNSFAYNKSIITEPELQQFYGTYSKDLADNRETPKADAPAAEIAKTEPRNVVAPSPSAPRGSSKIAQAETQTYATAEISVPSDMDVQAAKDLQEVLSTVGRDE